ncbi:ATP-binding protein [Streptomyces sp. NPDC050388]|uniref:ATP-binding protein n=1 Tax=Streptomyces sp. NPDC050388 TaxID=3155781 RepID=UPI003441D9E5
MQSPRLPLPTTAPRDIEWRLPQDVTDTAELLLSELMTNAHRHAKVPAGREIRARCELTDNRLRITVTDADETLPTPATACPDDESDRGLTLVETLADDWDAELRESGVGKTVWFEVALTRRRTVPVRPPYENAAACSPPPSGPSVIRRSEGRAPEPRETGRHRVPGAVLASYAAPAACLTARPPTRNSPAVKIVQSACHSTRTPLTYVPSPMPTSPSRSTPSPGPSSTIPSPGT